MAQTDLTAAERKANVAQAFKINKSIQAKHVAIIDDVVTTSSTINALTACLKEHGIEQVDIWCCARASQR